MSNKVNSTLMDNMRDNVHELWVIEGRPDLEDDCLQYCYDNIDRPVPLTMIEFLSSIVVKHYQVPTINKWLTNL
jgi:hypothetical protein